MVVESSAHAFQVSVDHLVRVEIVEAPRDAEQLSFVGEHGSMRQSRRTHEFPPIDILGFLQVSCHVALGHPLGNHAELEQLRRRALDTQNINVPHSPADDNLFAVFLGAVFQ